MSRTPYDWNGVERELGLFYLDRTEKPVLKAMTAFSEFVEALPFRRMPKQSRKRDIRRSATSNHFFCFMMSTCFLFDCQT